MAHLWVRLAACPVGACPAAVCQPCHPGAGAEHTVGTRLSLLGCWSALCQGRCLEVIFQFVELNSINGKAGKVETFFL